MGVISLTPLAYNIVEDNLPFSRDSSIRLRSGSTVMYSTAKRVRSIWLVISCIS